jgi:hypothetical protein
MVFFYYDVHDQSSDACSVRLRFATGGSVPRFGNTEKIPDTTEVSSPLAEILVENFHRQGRALKSTLNFLGRIPWHSLIGIDL